MTAPLEETLLPDLAASFARLRRLAEGALTQVDDAAFFLREAPGADPIAILVKHVGGNLRSRWRDFLTTDGEKPDRHRDREFELLEGDDRASLLALWAEGWGHLEATFAALTPTDATATVTIRGEPHSVVEASLRSLGHVSYHVGQIVDRAKRLRGEAWETLSVPRGGTVAFNQNPSPYLER